MDPNEIVLFIKRNPNNSTDKYGDFYEASMQNSLIIKIFGFLSATDLPRVSRVCKLFAEKVKELKLTPIEGIQNNIVIPYSQFAISQKLKKEQKKEKIQTLEKDIVKGEKILKNYDDLPKKASNYYVPENECCYIKANRFFHSPKTAIPATASGILAGGGMAVVGIKTGFNFFATMGLTVTSVITVPIITALVIHYYRKCRYPDVTVANVNTQKGSLEDLKKERDIEASTLKIVRIGL